LTALKYNLQAVLFSAVMLGIYDGTMGFWLSIKFKANSGFEDAKAQEFLGLYSAVYMAILSLAFAFIGYGLTKL
jgi:hypothetical protein